MTDPQILKALVEVLLFLELSDDKVLDPDAAVSAMEQMASNLQAMATDRKLALIEEIRAVAPHYGDHSKLVREIPEALGLTENT